MLLNLYVKNFVLIKEISLDLEEGFNVISGETGAGKSILLAALNLLKGERFNKTYLGKFDNYTLVEGIFALDGNSKKFLEDNDFIIEGDQVVLSRKLNEKNSIAKINNRPVNLSFLGEVSERLFDIHGQHSQLVALNKSNYLKIIDSFNEECKSLTDKIRENLSKKSLILKEYESIDLSEDQIIRDKDILDFQISEIESFDFKNYDENSLNNEYKRFSNMTEILEGLNKASYLINDNRNNSLKDLINNLNEVFYDLSRYDNLYESMNSEVINIKEMIYELSRNIENYIYTLDIDEERIKIIEDTFTKIEGLKRKYGRTIDDIMSFYKDSKSRLSKLENIESEKTYLSGKIKEIEDENILLAKKLTNLRKDIVSYLEKRIVQELEEMNMNYIEFKIAINKTDKITDRGNDIIDFLISTNKGQGLNSLSSVSSGGEISRFMLALKASLAEKEDVQSLIFDEIDTGISGKTADIVGLKLKKISKYRQLIVITHLPQIASHANSHYLIKKFEDANLTVSHLEKLNKEERVYEIARLISGSDITNQNLLSAKELLEINGMRTK